jgi:hypothetical protein
VSRPALRPTQTLSQWAPEVCPWSKARPWHDADNSHNLVPRSRMNRSYISSPPFRLHGGSGTALRILLYVRLRVLYLPNFIFSSHQTFKLKFLDSFLLFPKRVTRSVPLISLDLTPLITSVEECKLWVQSQWKASIHFWNILYSSVDHHSSLPIICRNYFRLDGKHRSWS